MDGGLVRRLAIYFVRPIVAQAALLNVPVLVMKEEATGDELMPGQKEEAFDEDLTEPGRKLWMVIRLEPLAQLGQQTESLVRIRLLESHEQQEYRVWERLNI